MLVLTFAFVVILLTFLWIRSRKPANFLPGPTPLPLIGNLHNLLGESNILEMIRKLRKQYGDVFCLSIGEHWTVMVNGRENLKEMFVKNGEFTSGRPDTTIMQFLRMKGIASSNGSTWKHNRTFTMTKLRDFGFGKRSFETSIMEELKEFLKFVDDKRGKPFQLTEILNTSVANALMSILDGKRLDYNDEKTIHYLDIVSSITSSKALTGPVNFIPWLGKLPFDPFGTGRLLKNFNEIFAYWTTVIQEHKKNLDENNLDNFIDIYLHEMAQAGIKDQFQEDQLLSIIVDSFIAGIETTSTTIKWFILYLLHYPEVQDKMQTEIDKIVGSGRLPALSDKPSMPYCEAVMYETFRLSNIGPLSLPHMATSDFEYKGYVIPKGCRIIACLDSAVIDEETYPSSFSFQPERFLDDDGNLHVTKTNSVMNFSLGRRVCMGEALAKMEAFLNMTSLVQRFTFRPPENESVPSKDPLFGFVQQPEPFSVRAISRT